MASKRLSLAALVLVLLCFPLTAPGAPPGAAAAPGPPAPVAAGSNREAAPRMTVSVADGLLSLEAREAGLADLLRAVAEKSGIDLVVGEGVGGKVTLRLAGVTLEEALRQLCASRAVIYEYDPRTKTGRIVAAGAFTTAPDNAAGRSSAAAARSPEAAAVAVERTGSVIAAAGGETALPAAASPPVAQREPRSYDSRGRLLYQPHELLVRFDPRATAAQIAALHLRLGSTVLRGIEKQKIHRIRVREGISEREAATLYAAEEIVAVAELHALRYPLLAPNDPYFVSNGQWGLSRIRMPDAWEITTGKADVVVAVIDTGVDTRHPDLAGNLLPGRDLAGASKNSETDSDADPMDKNGHGTHVAGIIAAVGNNGIGIAGVGWGLRILPLKVAADDSAAEMLTFDIIAAIDEAIAQRVRIVNCSFGGELPDPPGVEDTRNFQLEYEAFDRLRQAGILAVCAAGNGYKDINNNVIPVDNDASSRRIYPASHALDNIVSVAASLNTAKVPVKPENLWDSSNYGLGSVDLMAPGEEIRGPGLCPATGTCSSYLLRNGTSMAAAHVSGVAGLLLSRNPELGYGLVKSALLASVDRIDAVATKLASGGRLNAAEALHRVCFPADLTGEGRIGLEDVMAALRVAAGLTEVAEVCGWADADRDGRIGLAEAIYGLRILSGVGR